MVGIDYTKAGLREREIFAFTPSQLSESLKNIGRTETVNGCVILSTCNRTELWVSGSKNNLIELLCKEKGVSKAVYKDFFKLREEEDAIRRLFETACGMRSQILGEDQILAQVKNAINAAREAGTADELLEKLFQTAVTSAKKIKSSVRLTSAEPSVAAAALIKAEAYFPDLKKTNCLVIGNGEMGRLTAAMFAESGAKTWITLRRYHQNETAPTPEGCGTIAYDRRAELIPRCDVIVSATLSPHFTVTKEQLTGIENSGKRHLFIGLAVPRDIDERISAYQNAVITDMDHIGIKQRLNQAALAQANRVIAQYKSDFYKWMTARQYIGYARVKTALSPDEIFSKLQRDVKALPLSPAEKSGFANQIWNTVQKEWVSK